MRRSLARLAALSAFAVSLAACSNGPGGTSLPFSGGPNSAGGGTGLLQNGATGSSLLRFIQGSPDVGKVDICIDQASVSGVGSTSIAYKGYTLSPLTIASGIAHTVSIYTVPTTGPGSECGTAPGPYFGTAAVATTTILPAANTRNYLVLGGRAGSTLGLYYFPSPTSFAIAPTSPEAQLFNASPTFGKVGLGYTLVAGGPAANLISSLNPPLVAKVTSASSTLGSYGLAPLPSQPAAYFAGKPVTSGVVVPLTSEPPAAVVTGNTYVADVFSIDSTNPTGIDVVSISELTNGIGF